MANRGRDLTISILSNMDEFDTGQAARDLEELGDSAEKMGEQVEDASKKAEGSLDDFSADKATGEMKDLGSTAQTTAGEVEQEFDSAAERVDAAFDKISQSSATKLRKVDDDARAAGGGMDAFKDNVISSGQQAATSFTGDMEDITGSLQDVSSNALAAFGPYGAIAGMAAAAGLALIVRGLQDAAEEANKAREETSELAQEIIDAGGAMDQVDLAGKLQEWALEIADNKSWWEFWQDGATTNLHKVDKALEESKVTTDEYLSAWSSADPQQAADVLKTLTGELEALNAEQQRYIEMNQADRGDPIRIQQVRDEISAREDLIDELETEQEKRQQAAREAEILLDIQEQEVDAKRAAFDATGDYAAVLDDQSRATEIAAKEEQLHTDALIAKDWALQQASDSFGNYQHAVEATNEQLELAEGLYDSVDASLDGHADAVEAAARRVEEEAGKAGDSWEDYKSTAEVGLADVEVAMDKQIEALTNFNANIETLAQQGGDAYVAAAYEMAEEYGVPVEQMAQMLVDAPAGKQEEIVGKHREIGTLSGEAQVSATAQGMANKQYETRQAATNVYSEVEGILSKDITMPTKVSNVPGADAARVRANAQASLGTITIPVTVSRNVRNIYSHVRSWL